MSKIRVNEIEIQNYRSFGEKQVFKFPSEDYKKPIAIVGYNNAGKTNLINAIKFGLYESVREDTFDLKDFHNCSWNNPPMIKLNFKADINDKNITSYNNYDNIVYVKVEENMIKDVIDVCDYNNFNGNMYSKKWVIKQNAPIFYINFHDIKNQLSTKKTSWGNLTSFLAKHIKKIVKFDETMKKKKSEFEDCIKDSTNRVMKDSTLQEFISRIKKNYSKNLRDISCSCSVEFGLPDYEDIFLEMIFKIGLNGDKEKLLPLDHFGDGYISMFIMAVLQSIAESCEDDKCLFLFEEPESFLHENHQEYFYKTVLCGLSSKGHQVIYTTHSDRMVDIFDTQGLIRIEFDEDKKQTVKKYNNISKFTSEIKNDIDELIDLTNYNEYIKIIEPNLNKILFSRKVLLLEGPNDVLVYNHIIKKKINSKSIDNLDSDTFLNFYNMSIIAHHGKPTAILLIDLCNHLGVEYYVINDFDFNIELSIIQKLKSFKNIVEYKGSKFYQSEIAEISKNNKKGNELSDKDKKSMMTVNYNLIERAGVDKIHFNIPRLEEVLQYKFDDKSSMKIWEHIKNETTFEEKIFPRKLELFLEINNI